MSQEPSKFPRWSEQNEASLVCKRAFDPAVTSGREPLFPLKQDKPPITIQTAEATQALQL